MGGDAGGLRAVVDLLEQAGRDIDAAADYTRRAQQWLAEGGLLGIVRNMDRIVVKLDADHARVDGQRRQVDSLRVAAAAIDDESVPQQIVDVLTPVAGGIGAALAACGAVDAELVDTQELTGEVLVGGAPQHIQTRIQRVRDTLDDARRGLESAAAAVDGSLRRAYQAGGSGGVSGPEAQAEGGGSDPAILSASLLSGGVGTPGTVVPPRPITAEEAVGRAVGRVTQLQEMLPEATRHRVTMGVGIGRDTAGSTRMVVASSERNGYLRKQVRDAVGPGEEIATGDGTMHAEVRALKYMEEHGIDPVTVGAGRPICSECEQAIVGAGVVPASPLKGASSRGRSS